MDFDLDWIDYENGFGDLNGEHWLGAWYKLNVGFILIVIIDIYSYITCVCILTWSTQPVYIIIIINGRKQFKWHIFYGLLLHSRMCNKNEKKQLMNNMGEFKWYYFRNTISFYSRVSNYCIIIIFLCQNL